MKERELRQHATCDACGRKIGEAALPIFMRVTVEEFGLDLDACRRQQGLGMMIGAPLAMFMGPDADLAKPLGEPVVLTICCDCRPAQHNLLAMCEHKSEPEAG